MRKIFLKIVLLCCLSLVAASCLNSNRANVASVDEDTTLYETSEEDSISPTAFSQTPLDSSKVIVGKWTVYDTPQFGTCLLVIYEENGKYYADNINNGIWSNDPYELIKIKINGNLGFKPVAVDECSETYEIRDNGVYTKFIDGTGGMLFYNAEDNNTKSTNNQKKEYDPIVNAYKCHKTGNQIIFYSNYTGTFYITGKTHYDFTWIRNDNMVTIYFPEVGYDSMTFDEEKGTLTLNSSYYGKMVFTGY